MKWYSTSDGKYSIESMSAATFPGAHAMLKDKIFPELALCKATGVDKDPLAMEELLELCAVSALDGVSMVAVDNDTGEVVACTFSKMQVPPSETGGKTFFEYYAENCCKRGPSRAYVRFVDDLQKKCNFFERYNVDCSVYIIFVGILEAHRRRGLSTLLIKASVDVIKKLKNGPVAPMTVEDLGPKYSFLKSSELTKKVPKLCIGLASVIGTKKSGISNGFITSEMVNLKNYVPNKDLGIQWVAVDSVVEMGAVKIDSKL